MGANVSNHTKMSYDEQNYMAVSSSSFTLGFDISSSRCSGKIVMSFTSMDARKLKNSTRARVEILMEVIDFMVHVLLNRQQ